MKTLVRLLSSPWLCLVCITLAALALSLFLPRLSLEEELNLFPPPPLEVQRELDRRFQEFFAIEKQKRDKEGRLR